MFEAEGMNDSTGTDLVYNLRHMLAGTVYKRGMSLSATKYFLAGIERDFSSRAFSNALQAIRLHIRYNASASKIGIKKMLEDERWQSAQGDECDSTLDDLVDPAALGGKADRGRRVVTFFKRNSKVRTTVLRRANGNCQFCGKQSFRTNDDSYYLEAHHIISLSKQGEDSLSNVIALCPNDHRRAHFSVDAEKIEREMLQIICGKKS